MNPTRIYPALFLFVCLLGSCLESYEEELPSLTSIIVQNQFFNKLEKALLKSQLWLKLSNTNLSEETGGHYTLFGPTDEAFKDFERISGLPIESMDSSSLREILSYHLANGQIDRATLESRHRITSDLGPEMQIVKNGSDLYINGSKILFTDVVTKNGNFHGLDKVLWGFNEEPAALIRMLNEKRPLSDYSFSIMEKAIELSQMNTEIWNECTFFLPTDSAFQTVGIEYPNDLSSWTVQEINRLIGHHLFIGAGRFSSEFTFMETSLSGINTEISLANASVWKVKGRNKTIETRPIVSDIRSGQAVVHIIDRVIVH
jgi:uncharacterized surface protein with fasciclin (FAS1) repeats